MGQHVLAATVALAIAVIFTAAIAIATLAAETLSRVFKVIGVVAVIAFAAVALQCSNLRINFTGSMPIGIYLLLPLQPNSLKRGMLVAACPPTRAAELGQQRGYVATGPCADDTELLLKSVAAIAGDKVDLSAAGVTVNGCLLPYSRAEARDRSQRTLKPWPRRHYRLPAGKLWLYGDNNRSWDSRYWGPVTLGDVSAIANPVAVVPSLERRQQFCQRAL